MLTVVLFERCARRMYACYEFISQNDIDILFSREYRWAIERASSSFYGTFYILAPFTYNNTTHN